MQRLHKAVEKRLSVGAAKGGIGESFMAPLYVVNCIVRNNTGKIRNSGSTTRMTLSMSLSAIAFGGSLVLALRST